MSACRPRCLHARGAAILAAAVALGAPAARAELPSAQEFLKLLEIPAADVEKAKAGDFIDVEIPPSNEREITAGFVFLVKGVTPSQLVKQAREGELDRIDPNTIAVHLMKGEPGPADFASLTLEKDGAKQAQVFLAAEAGEDLNLSSEEIAAFQKLGSGAAQAVVEDAIRRLLLARLQAYRAKGLGGIAPYARGGGKTRAPADDLRSASEAATVLRSSIPAAYELLLDYPKGKPPGFEEIFRWSQIEAHGAPTLVLTHNFYVPEGDAWLAVQRQFYVSTGYNCEQAVAAFLPVQGGTAVFYGNRTSTDQVTGFGGGAKRSIGSKVLASQLEELFEKSRKAAGGR